MTYDQELLFEDLENANIKCIDAVDILTVFHKGVSMEEAEDIFCDLQEGHCIYAITEDDGVTIVDFKYYDKHESDGQLLSGSRDSYIKFEFNDHEIQQDDYIYLPDKFKNFPRSLPNIG